MSITKKCAEAGQYLTFALNSQNYGVPIATVREINQMCQITPIPQTPDFIKGVIDLRGSIIPVVDLKLKLRMKLTTAQTGNDDNCIVVIEGTSGQIGIIIDEIREVLELSGEDIRPRPALGDNEDLDYVTGMGKVNDDLIVLLDIVEFLANDNMQEYVDQYNQEMLEEKKKSA